MNRESWSARNHFIVELNDALEASERVSDSHSLMEVKIVTTREEPSTNIEGNWLFAVGLYRTWAKGNLKKCGKKYELDWSFNFRDNYDWSMTNNLRAGFVTDREMALLHRYGVAKEYEMVGEHRVNIVWEFGERYSSGASVNGVSYI